jgi:hypothetical protein
MLYRFSSWLTQYVDPIAVAMVASLLFIFSTPVNRIIQRRLRPLPFFLRLGVFILICSAGSALAMAGGVGLVRAFLLSVGDDWFAPVVLLIFIAIGSLAERNRHL